MIARQPNGYLAIAATGGDGAYWFLPVRKPMSKLDTNHLAAKTDIAATA